MVLEVGGVGVCGQDLGGEQQLTGRHGDGLEVGHHLRLVLLVLNGEQRGKGSNQVMKVLSVIHAHLKLVTYDTHMHGNI